MFGWKSKAYRELEQEYTIAVCAIGVLAAGLSTLIGGSVETIGEAAIRIAAGELGIISPECAECAECGECYGS